MGRVAQVDPDQLAALRRLRAAFGVVEVLAVIEDDDQEPVAAQAGLFDQHTDEPEPSSLLEEDQPSP